MRAGQWKRSGVVIESCPRPICSGVACGAGGGEVDNGVWRGVGPIPIRFMAGETIGRNGCVVVIGVALHARNSCMGACQRKDRCMIKSGGCPSDCCVAQAAISGEGCCNVIRIRGSSKIRLMARVAGSRRRSVVVVHMALRACDSCVHAC